MDNSQIIVASDGTEAVIDLAALAGFNMRDVESYRGSEATPAGLYHWQVKNGELTISEMRKGGKGADAEDKVNRAIVTLELEARNCLSCKDRDKNPEDLIGITHYERVVIFDGERDLGKVHTVMEDSGFFMQAQSESLEELLNEFVGWEFIGGITQRANKNDPDRPYAELDLRHITPVHPPVAPAAPQPAAPVAPATPTPAQQPSAGPFAGFMAPSGGQQ